MSTTTGPSPTRASRSEREAIEAAVAAAVTDRGAALAGGTVVCCGDVIAGTAAGFVQRRDPAVAGARAAAHGSAAEAARPRVTDARTAPSGRLIGGPVVTRELEVGLVQLADGIGAGQRIVVVDRGLGRIGLMIGQAVFVW